MHGEFNLLLLIILNTFISNLSLARKAFLFLTLVPDDLFLYQKIMKNVIALNNPLSFNKDKIKPSSLKAKTLLLIGRGDDKWKRFDIVIQAMKIISDYIPDSKLLIITKMNQQTKYLVNLVNNLNLTNNVDFTGYKKNPEIYFKNASIHLQTSLSEAFPMVIAETKAYWISNIVTGKKYLSLTKNGTINVNDNDIKGIAKEAIKFKFENIINLLYLLIFLNLLLQSKYEVIWYNNEIIW